MNDTDLLAMLRQRDELKQQEAALAEERKFVDAKLADLLRDKSKPEGTISHEVGGLRLKVSYGITRSADTEKLQAAWAQLSEQAQKTFGWKASVSVTALRLLGSADTAAVSAFITSKPSTPTVSVEIIK